MPTAIPVTPVSMNYASVVFVFFASISVVWYVISGRKNFTGPPVAADEVEHDGTTLDGGNVGRILTNGGNGFVGTQEGKTHSDPPK